MRTTGLAGKRGLIAILLVAPLCWPGGDSSAQTAVGPTTFTITSYVDFTIQSVAVGCPSGAPAPLVGRCNMVTVLVKNAGSNNYMQPIDVRLSGLGYTYYASLPLGLAAGATGEAFFKVQIGTTASTFTAVVDAANKVAESSETNNARGASFPAPTQYCPKT